MGKRFDLTDEEKETILNNPYLTDREREIFLLYYIKEMPSYLRVGLEMEPPLSESTVEKTITKLKEKIIKYCINTR